MNINKNQIIKNKILYKIKKNYLYKIGLAYSGGTDSYNLYLWIKLLINNLILIHINHNINILNKNWIIKCWKIAKINNTPIIIKGIKIKKLKNIEKQLRIKRYKALTNIAKKKGIKFIITAHQINDFIETFFIKITKGTNIKKLYPIKRSFKINNIKIYRPILLFKKQKYKNKLCIIDKSNFDIKNKRNLFRLFIIKLITKNNKKFCFKFIKTLTQLKNILINKIKY